MSLNLLFLHEEKMGPEFVFKGTQNEFSCEIIKKKNELLQILE